MTRYVFMLRTEIMEFVRRARCESLTAMYEVARYRELELETHLKKRKTTHNKTQSQIQYQTQTRSSSSHTAKKIRSSDARSSGKKTHPCCSKCGKAHKGYC